MIRQGFIATAAAWMALTATAAQAQAVTKAATPRLTPDEAEAAMMMMAPGAIRGFIKACDTKLPANAYLKRSGTALVARYQAAATAAEPLAGRVMSKMMGGSGDNAPTGVASMLAPMGEMMMGSMAGKLDVRTCGMADQALGLLDPLPAHNVAALIVMAAQADAKGEKDKSPFTICPAGAPLPAPVPAKH